METMKQSGPMKQSRYWWLSGGLCDGYVFPAVVELETFSFWFKLDLEGHDQPPPKTLGILA